METEVSAEVGLFVLCECLKHMKGRSGKEEEKRNLGRYGEGGKGIWER